MSRVEELIEVLESLLKGQEADVGRRQAVIARMLEQLKRDEGERQRGTAALRELRQRFLGESVPPVYIPPPAPIVPPIYTAPPTPITPITQPPAAPVRSRIDPNNPGPFPGENALGTQWALEDAAAISKLSWKLHKAIMVQETGHFGKDPNAKAWLFKNNPGGMKNTDFVRTIGGIPTEGTYAEFPNWYVGFIAHGHFLAQERYDDARDMDDPLEQAVCVGAAGYAGGSQEWLDIVQSLIRQYNRTGPATQPSPPPSISVSRANVVAGMRTALGKGISYGIGTGGGPVTGPWPKLMDCSAYVNRGLGISRDETGLNTDGMVYDGRTPGGLFTQVSFDDCQPGDPLVVGKGGGHEYGHVAMITEIDATKKGKDRILKVIDCASGRGDGQAIQEGSPKRLLDRGAIAVRYHGLLA